MNYFITIVLFLSGLSLHGQRYYDTVKVKVSETFWAIPGAIYIDSVKVEISKTYLDARNVERVEEIPDDNIYLHRPSRRVILITRKKKVSFLSLSDLYIKSGLSNIDSIKFYIDGKFAEDTSNIRFEPAAIIKMKLKKNKQARKGSVSASFRLMITTTIKHRRRFRH